MGAWGGRCRGGQGREGVDGRNVREGVLGGEVVGLGLGIWE